MAFRFFTIPIRDSDTAEAELNSFLGAHRVLSVDRRLIEQGSDSFWSLCIDYLPASGERSNGHSFARGRTRVDYKEILSPEEFGVFAKLRQLRKEIAQADAIPIYAVFTNEQLAQMVQKRAATRSALEEIAGVGDARIEKYGSRFLELLAAQGSASHATDGKAV